MLATSMSRRSVLKTDRVLRVASMMSMSVIGVKRLVDSLFASMLSWILILSMLSSGVESICRKEVLGRLPRLQLVAMCPGLPQYMQSFSLKRHSLSLGESFPRRNEVPRLRP